jgi:thiol-disulfide isomerase/thioredoxin
LLVRNRWSLAEIPWHSKLVRAAVTGAIVAAAVVGLWQGGVLFRDPDEDVTVTTPGGGSAVIQIRAADTSVETPGVTGRKVGLNLGDLAPDFEASTLEGDRVRLSDFRGKAVYLNFWASWCSPCRAEMPDIIGLLAKYEADGLVVLAMNAGEAYGAANGFVGDLRMQSLTEITLDPSLRVAERYRVSSMPTSIFIDAEGAITRVHPGFATADQMDGFARQALGLDSAVRQ